MAKAKEAKDSEAGITAESLAAAIAGMSAEQRMGLANLLGSTSQKSTTPKFSTAIEAVQDVEGAIEGLKECLAAKTDQEFAEKSIEFGNKYPSLHMAAQVNSSYRNKKLAHSYQVALSRLTAKGN